MILIRPISMRFIIFFIWVFGVLPAFASSNDTMDQLLAGNKLQITTASGVVVVVIFDANGSYVTNTESSGSWTVNGEEICTVKAGAIVESCGALPFGKAVGDSWETSDASGAPVISKIIAQ